MIIERNVRANVRAGSKVDGGHEVCCRSKGKSKARFERCRTCRVVGKGGIQQVQERLNGTIGPVRARILGPGGMKRAREKTRRGGGRGGGRTTLAWITREAVFCALGVCVCV